MRDRLTVPTGVAIVAELAEGFPQKGHGAKGTGMAVEVVRTGAGEKISKLLNPVAMARNLWGYRELTLQLAHRDIVGRYRSSWLGLLWTVITPLILLAIYTFVFAVVFNARWGNDPANESRGVFALTMFCGMLLFNLFSEVANRAPTSIVDNANYVKRVVFPLEVFMVSALLTAVFNMMVGFGVWLAGWTLITGSLPSWTLIWLPVVLVPVCLTTLGVGWFLASLGVFVRDVGHAVFLGTQVLFFMTPIFYRVDRVPESFQFVMMINPLTHAVEDARRVMLGHKYLEWIGETGGGAHPDWPVWGVTLIVSAAVALFGYAFFMKSKKAFSDVI